MKNINVLLFDDFAPLDAFGPANVFSPLSRFFGVGIFSMKGGIVTASPGIRMETRPVSEALEDGILLIPGGFGTRKLVEDVEFIRELKELAVRAPAVLSVCTGSALLSRTGLLKGVRATSNKLSFEWVVSQDPGVTWVRKARWVHDGKFYTSSGVSAGIDMALGFVRDELGSGAAESVCKGLEYVWNDDCENDPFA
jgi:transcriptional regulator GlxA family with amidase domain